MQRAICPGVRYAGKKTALAEDLQRQIAAEVETLIGVGAVEHLDFEAIETAARRKAMRVAARAVEQRLNADTSDHAGPMSPCAGGRSARYAGRREKTHESVLGPLEARARRLSLRAVRSGLLSARPSARPGG